MPGMSILILMSMRLQVVMDEEEAERYKRAAARRQLSLSEWVRRCLRRAEKSESSPEPAQKLAALKRARQHNHPTGTIGQILYEIESGRDLR